MHDKDDGNVEDAQITTDPDLSTDDHHEPMDEGAAPEHEDGPEGESPLDPD